MTRLGIAAIIMGTALIVPACAADEEKNADLEQVAKQVGKYNNNPLKEKTTVSYHDVEYTVYPLKMKKKEVGAVISTGATGFAGPIVVMVGFDADGQVKSYKVLEQSETPRWGDVVGTWFQRSGQGSIIGKSMKDGDLKDKKDGGTVDGISNSTITTRAFLHAVNSAYKVCKGQEPDKQVIQSGHYGPRGGGRGGFPGPQGAAQGHGSFPQNRPQ